MAVALATLSFASSASAIPLIDNGATVGIGTGATLVSRPPDVQDTASVLSSYPTALGLKADGLRLQGIAQVYQSLSAVPDVLERYAAVHPYGVGLTSVSSSPTVGRPPDVSDAAYAARTIVPGQPSGFDWGDYAIGIGSGAGFMLLLAAGLAFGSQQRHRMQTA